MLTKLTLTIEKDVVEKAKTYAGYKKKSVSRLVEEYLSNLSQDRLSTSPDLPSPITDQLAGMFQDDGREYKDLLAEARDERYR